MPLANRLKQIVYRLWSNEDTVQDRRIARDSVLNGNLVFARGNKNVVVGGSFSGALVSGNNNRLFVQISEPSAQSVGKKVFPRPKGAPPNPPSLLFVGRGNDIAITKRMLLGEGSTVMVDGLPGVGKTSLASAISRDQDLLTSFPDGVLWTSLGQKPNLNSVLGSWGRVLGLGDMVRVPTLEDIVVRLQELLLERRMLLIVDDAWDVGHLAPFLRLRGRGSGLLITTRLPKVSAGLTSTTSHHHRIEILSEDDALTLLWALAPEAVQDEPGACRSLVRDLERLPLALHVSGRLLHSEAKLGWGVRELIEELRSSAALIQENAPEDRAEGDSIPTVSALLRRSSDFLDYRTCGHFARLGLFMPKPASFSLKQLASLWQERDPKPFVRSLVAHGLLEPSSTGRFQMHALLVAHAKSLLEDDEESEPLT